MNSSAHRNRKIVQNEYTGIKVVGEEFYNCDFSQADLSETQFIDCKFYDHDTELSCKFRSSTLAGAVFKNCDLTMCSFNFAKALGIEMSGCKLQGADFTNTSFMNMITNKTWFCHATITDCNLSYANFSKVILEKCELWGNRWVGANIKSASFNGSDLSSGEFNSFDWECADFRGCDLRNSDLGVLDVRRVNLDGAKLEAEQICNLARLLGVEVV
ncbi:MULTISPECIES: Qnr family pentapeptide repeat protein [Pseudomonas syringae group]|jgi:fluoroquinolone resistance protein|uniref:Fluoroquinolone resistance protein n=1 Tax=Pseudomonas avellanae pv. morsprunorum TaxID=3380385 RepID=A0ABX4YTK5_9PSED|nr:MULTISPECIES: Qnr family pentapeptide repeat protein [Pseudomonas syringae group]NVL36981.1 Qnr family pentapeptide repeat protein [Pseudomonas syringae pv. actinidiae]KWS36844.1 fluoroquinolone resistance protein [Pseudomonas amygdali pv. ulmi]KWS62542.1 fluoroquinolone resistance protein [Pseudomonas amygdali pv. morsprunorum]KWS89453.1 fluoroquinolone resistance protein [Pseudomonas syringae pv. daphniphylli]NVL50957.1 Qnr family pentapeptide repeat protein [Pseudomonas syringae pv. acti